MYQSIEDKINAWQTDYQYNDDRGKHFVDFVLAGNQWKSDTKALRTARNKESLVFNRTKNIVRQVVRQIKELDYSLTAVPLNHETQEDTQASNIASLFLQHILLGNDVIRNNKICSEKAIYYGYSFLLVTFKRENEENLNQIPTTRFYNDPSSGFWDLTANHPCKIDGEYCGIKSTVSRRKLLNKYGNNIFSKGIEIKDNDNIVIDYWFREYETENYILLKNGTYKREDLLTDDDKSNLMKEIDLKKYEKKNEIKDGTIELTQKRRGDKKIYFIRFLNGEILEDKKIYPTKDLPLIYYHALTYWSDKSKKFFTLPFAHHLEDPQRAYNYKQSQIATLSKSATDDKFFIQKTSKLNREEKLLFEKINEMGGAFPVDDVNAIKQVQCTQISPTLIEATRDSKSDLDELFGIQADIQNANNVYLSDRAIQRITNIQDSLNIDIQDKHIEFVDTVAEIIAQMIPKIITQERIIMVKNHDGSGETIIVNETLPSGEIRNNVKDITNKFKYDIKAGASRTMQNETTAKYLRDAYQINPLLLDTTKDIYFRVLDTPYAGELERRAKASMDKNLIDFSQGRITDKEYQEKIESNQKAQLQNQIHMQNADPKIQAMMTVANAQAKRVDIQEQDSITKRKDSIVKESHENDKLIIAGIEILMRQHNMNSQQILAYLNHQMESNKQDFYRYQTIKNQQEQQNIAPQQQEQQQGIMSNELEKGGINSEYMPPAYQDNQDNSNPVQDSQNLSGVINA